MEITLKNVQTVAALSEETLCFNASVYVDGKKVGEVSNRGTGGCNEYSIPHDLLQDLEARAELFTGSDFEPLDILIDSLLTTWETLKIGKRYTKKCGFPVIAYKGMEDFGRIDTYVLAFSSREAYESRLDSLHEEYDDTTPVADMKVSATL